MVKPLSGHANFDENIIFFLFFCIFWVKFHFHIQQIIIHLIDLRAVSILSASLFPIDEFNTILSTTIEISCFIFLFNSGKFVNFIIFSVDFNLLKPFFYNLAISFLYSPFLPLTIGANKYIVLFFGKLLTLSTISETDWDTIGLPVNGE